jgi:hypothetical protein
MKLRETFATTVQERIEPVVKVQDRRPTVLHYELRNLVVTPQWEQYVRRFLDAYTDAADRETEGGIGIWISGFFGSGKSLLLKVLGALLENKALDGDTAHDVFLERLPETSQDRSDIRRFLNVARLKLSTTAVGGNLHSMQASTEDQLALIAFKLFAGQMGYTANWPLAWAVEYYIDEQGRKAEYQSRVAELTGDRWDTIAIDPEIYLPELYQAAADVMPQRFKSPDDAERAVNAVIHAGVDPSRLVERLRRWCEGRDEGNRRHKLILQLDELGQWISAGNANARTMEVQALVEEAANKGDGRIWIAVTAHGDVQALRQNVQQEYYAKIIQRFAIQCKLSNDDISRVVEERVLRKTQPARVDLAARFHKRSGELTDLGRVTDAKHQYPTPDEESFPLFYPYMPWTVTAVPDVVKGIAQAANRDEALTGSNRTMIAVVQGAIIETEGLLESQAGRLLSLADLYPQLAADVPIETKTDLNQIRQSVPGATEFTERVARGLFLLGQAEYIATTLDNVARTVATSLDDSLSLLNNRVKPELERLVAAGFAKRVGDHYLFLTTQQRTFQDKVRARQQELEGQSYDLIKALRDHFSSEDSLRFDRPALHGREIPLRMELDGQLVRNMGAPVKLQLFSSLQRALEPSIGDDNAMRTRANSDPQTIYVRLDDVRGLRSALALFVATDEVAKKAATAQGGPEADAAREARQIDLPELREEVRSLLGKSVRGATLFFQGSIYQLLNGDSPSEAVRSTLGQLLPSVFPRFSEVTYQVQNEVSAIRAALSGNPQQIDLVGLGVFKGDGTLNESHALISTLRGRLPLVEQGQQPVNAGDLRAEFEKPPFGWDGNAIKVGLALLLRAGACRLIESGQTISDPSDPQAETLLAKENRFNTLRVQGMRSELTVPDLVEIRNGMQQLFNVKPPLVAATMHSMLGEELIKAAAAAQSIRQWAQTASCPLPEAFASDTSLIEELLNTPNATRRLQSFRSQVDRLGGYTQQLQNLDAFHHTHGQRYQEVRDFFNRMLNAGVDLPELRHFIDDWRTLSRERTITEPERWNELVKCYHSAEKAVEGQIERWRADAQTQMKGLHQRLETRLSDNGVPADEVAAEAAELAQLYDPVRMTLERANLSLYEARSLQTNWSSAELQAEMRLRELRQLYQPKPADNSRRLNWQSVAGRVELHNEDDLERLLERLRNHIAANLSVGGTVIIE